MDRIGGREDLALVDVVDAEGLEDLALDEVADAGLGHDGDRDGVHDVADQGGVGHAGDAALGADVGGDALEGHDGDGASFFGDACLDGEEVLVAIVTGEEGEAKAIMDTCSALTTSMITPPLSIRANPALTAKLESSPFWWPLVVGRSVAIIVD